MTNSVKAELPPLVNLARNGPIFSDREDYKAAVEFLHHRAMTVTLEPLNPLERLACEVPSANLPKSERI